MESSNNIKINDKNEREEFLKNLLDKLKIAENKYGIDILGPLKYEINKNEDVSCTKNRSWNEFKLKKSLLKGLEGLGYAYPSPVQVECIPHSLKGRDMVVRSKNGTGKTAAYIIPILNQIDVTKKNLQAVILVPTRELALQVSRIVKNISCFMNVDVMPTYGGTNLHEDILRASKGVHIIVGTPGRILDLTERNLIIFENCKYLVFDEADKLLSVEFKDTIQRILSYRPDTMAINMYSATFPSPVHGFVEQNLKEPVHVNLMKELALKALTQFYALVKNNEKLHCLKTLILKLKLVQCIIFCNSVSNVELLAKRITEMGIPSYFIHSKMAQKERNTVFHNFLEGKCKILVSSDLITRGIDVPSVNCVINFDFPKSAESYLHRIGRSGRFGNIGISINLITDRDKEKMLSMEEKLNVEIYPVSHKNFKDFTI